MREIRNKRCAMWRNHHRSQSEETDQVNVFLLGRNHMEMCKIMMSVAEIRGSSLDIQKFNEYRFEQYL